MTNFKIYQDEEYTHSVAATSRKSPLVSQEAAAWLRRVLQAAGPHTSLHNLLRGNNRKTAHIVTVLNQASKHIAAAFPSSSPAPAPGAPDALAKAAACKNLYQLALHRILLLALQETAENLSWTSVSDVPASLKDEAIAAVLAQEAVLAGLITACCEVVNFAYLTDPEESFPVVSLRMGQNGQWMELMQGLTWLRHCMKHLQGALAMEGLVQGLPDFPIEMASYVSDIETRILEELAWTTGSSYYQRVKNLGSCTEASSQNQDPNRCMVTTFLRKVCALAEKRCGALCHQLCASSRASRLPSGTQLEKAFTEAACAMMNSLLYRHLDVLEERHLTVVILGAICSVARGHRIKVRYSSLLHAASACSDGGFNDNAALQNVSFAEPMTLQWAKKKAKDRENGAESSESDDGWGDEEEEEEATPEAAVVEVRVSPKTFYNKLLVPLILLHGKGPEEDLTELLGSTSEALHQAVGAAGQDVCLDPGAHAVPASKKRATTAAAVASQELLSQESQGSLGIQATPKERIPAMDCRAKASKPTSARKTLIGVSRQRQQPALLARKNR